MDRKNKGFTRLMGILNRKQIPVCKQCHQGIHSGKYDGLKLEDLAYDSRKPSGLDTSSRRGSTYVVIKIARAEMSVPLESRMR
jgi:hypothetical protein